MENRRMIPDGEKELRKALWVKSDDELRTIINESGIYGKGLVQAAREELTARVAGKSRQKTAEEIEREEAEQQRLEQERLQKEKEEQERKRKEAEAEAARRNAIARKQAKRAGIIVGCILVVGALVGFFIWNNTDERLVERGRNALAKGNEEKAEKLFERAEKTNKDAAYELWLLKNQEHYLIQAADLGHQEACKVYGKQLMQEGHYNSAIPYLEKADYDAEQQYLLGCAYWNARDWEKARKALENAAVYNDEAKVRLGDWYLCRGEKKDYLKALEFYERANVKYPGVKEKRQVLQDLQKRNRNFSSDSWENARFWGEEQTGWDRNNWRSYIRSVRRGIYENVSGNYRFIGKFNSTGGLLPGLGIVAYGDGRIYVGEIQIVNTKNNKYSVYYTGHGVHTDEKGSVESGTWKKDRLVGSYTVTDIFGETKTVKP